jgi:hypothetical protein
VSRYHKWIVAGLLAIAVAPQACKLLLPTGSMLAAFFPDDCFYYYKTAQNIATGLGSTFDGENFTNGYHPLWMLVCVAAAYVTSSPTGYLYLMLALNLLVVAALSVRMVTLFKDRLGVWLAVLVVILMNGQRKCSGGVFSGLETPLYILLVLETANFMVKMSWQRRTHVVWLGALGGLAFLTRTSFVLFVPAACAYLLYRYRTSADRPSWRGIMLAAIPGLMLTVPYLAWNYYETGHIQQISGLTKNLIFTGGFASWHSFAQAALGFANNSGLVLLPLPLSALFVAMVGASLAVLWRRGMLRLPWQDARLIILVIFAATEGAYYFVNYGPSVFMWHMAPMNVILFLAAAYFIRSAMQCLNGRSAARAALAVLAIIVGAACPWQNIYYSHTYRYSPLMYDAAIWMRSNLPADARIGVWNAGLVGYFSQRRVINLDGVINGTELYEYQRRGVAWQYILDHKIGYIGDVFTVAPSPEAAALKDRLSRIYVSQDRIQDIHGRPVDARYYIWKVE